MTQRLGSEEPGTHRQPLYMAWVSPEWQLDSERENPDSKHLEVARTKQQGFF
jgi:hypothetical protein